jgi:hypothetical protein
MEKVYSHFGVPEAQYLAPLVELPPGTAPVSALYQTLTRITAQRVAMYAQRQGGLRDRIPSGINHIGYGCRHHLSSPSLLSRFISLHTSYTARRQAANISKRKTIHAVLMGDSTFIEFTNSKPVHIVTSIAIESSK